MVTCLGVEFENDVARRKYFTEKLKEKLKDPEFRKIEGFPIGEDEDILALSDPPYYTACPNPFIGDFIKYYGKPFDPTRDNYRQKPFAVDSQFGKTSNPITRAHPYHTKVPPEAVEAFCNHYLGQEGGVMLDCFCGIGMSGVGFNLYQEKHGSKAAAILCDLSSIASFATHNYNSKAKQSELGDILERIVDKLDAVIKPSFLTCHNGWPSRGKQPDIFNQKNNTTADGMGTIEYIVIAEELGCPNCGSPNLLWQSKNIDITAGKIRDSYLCDYCGKKSTKADSTKIWETNPDPCRKGEVCQVFRQKPVLIYYTVHGKKFCKYPDPQDLLNIQRHWQRSYANIPIIPVPNGDKTKELISGNALYFHQCYHPMALNAFNSLSSIVKEYQDHILFRRICFALSPLYSSLTRMAVVHVSHFFKGGGGPFISNISGFLHFPSVSFIRNPVSALRLRINSVLASERLRHEEWGESTVSSCQSATDLHQVANDSIDYVFVDPPFGQNLMYSELNFFWECALQVRTNASHEAIINRTQKKKLRDYQYLMTASFKEIYRVLKPGRWLTVEFHNSKNSVWTAIQEGIEQSGFMVADVRILDKKLGSYNQNVSAGAPKSDLIISAYKPMSDLEERFKLTCGTENGCWDFICSHLKQLPVFVSKNRRAQIISERQNYLLFDRMLAFHVQRGVTIPFSAGEFYQGLDQRFSMRDEMYFMPEQVAEYDKKRMSVDKVEQLQLFVTDEPSAIQWLKQKISIKTQTFQGLHPLFLKEISGWKKNEIQLELSLLLNQNFLCYDGKGPVPEQIHAYLSSNWKEMRNLSKVDPSLVAKARDRWYVPDPNKGGDLEKLREKSLLKEFEQYKQANKKLKIFRLEAVRAGFKKAWQEKEYKIIINIADKIPTNVLEEDSKLLMLYDAAVTRSEAHA
ncbi:MAG: DNA methylase [Deltaproteobacteria bacterium]|nr:DNA methylase [Deltaproteobacteria bacterium]